MSKLPDRIETEFVSNEGYTAQVAESTILADLVVAVNELIEYLQEQSPTNQSRKEL